MDDVVIGEVEERPERVVVGRASSVRGEVVLVRRGGVDELVVNGVFAMDSTETSSEAALGRFAAGARRVLVGGLGLGYTVAAVLDGAGPAEADDALEVDVVELEEALVTWAGQRLTPTLARAADDPRVRLHVGDVATVLAGTSGPAGPWDAILLDVDNGPDFLVHTKNQALYAEPGLRTAYERLAPGGVLAIWCQAPSPALLATLRRIDAAAGETTYAVEREGRLFSYTVATLPRPAATSSAAASSEASSPGTSPAEPRTAG